MKTLALLILPLILLSLEASAQRIVKLDVPAPTGYNARGFSPNPFGSSASCTLAVPDTAYLTIKVYDEKQRSIRRIAPARILPGEYRLYWDGRDSVGSMAREGIYYLEVSVSSSSPLKEETFFLSRGAIWLQQICK